MDGGFFTRVASWSDEGVGVVRRGTVAKGRDISYKGVGLFGWGRGLLLSTWGRPNKTMALNYEITLIKALIST